MKKLNKKGQNAIEYMLIFVAVITFLVIALGKNGFVTTAIDNSLTLSIEAVGDMAHDVNYENVP